MAVRIYQPAKTAMQSGQAKTEVWLLEHDREERRTRDPLMGYTSSTDMRQQVVLEFATKDEAIAYARRNGLEYTVSEKKPRRRTPKSYADNFRYGRRQPWTH
ncbi:MAG: ETC complex I subunit [Pseudomonadota bacterium]